MAKFLELLEDSVIFQGLLVLLISCTVCYLYVTGGPVPENLDRLLFVIVGFFFGGKQVTAVSRVAQRLGNGRGFD